MYQFGNTLLFNTKALNFSNSLGGSYFGIKNNDLSAYLINPLAQDLSAIQELSNFQFPGTSYTGIYNAVFNSFKNHGFSKNDFQNLQEQTFIINFTDTSGKVVMTTQSLVFSKASIAAAGHNQGQGGLASALATIWEQYINAGSPSGAFTASLQLTPTAHTNKNGTTTYTYQYCDASGVPFTAYVQLTDQFNVDPLYSSGSDISVLLSQLTAHRKQQILNYLQGNDRNVVMNINEDTNTLIPNILQALGLSTNNLVNVNGQVVIAGGNFDDANSSNTDLIFAIGNVTQTLIGGTGNDTFVLDPNQTGNTVIDDSNGKGNGLISIGNTPLTNLNLTPVTGQSFTWLDQNGLQYQFAPDTRTLTISQGLLIGGGQIIIQNFDINQAQSANGYMGIHFNEQVAMAVGNKPHTIAEILNAQTSSALDPPPGAYTFTAYVSALSDQPQQVTINMTQGDATGFEVDTGNGLIPFSQGAVTLTIAPGQDSVTFGLVNIKPVTQATAVKLTATITDPASGTTVTSSAAEIDYTASPTISSKPPTFDHVITGDLTPVNTGTSSSPVYQYDSLGNLITDGTADPNFNDTLYGSTGNDQISTGDGKNYVYATQGGNDSITAGKGTNYIYAKQAGNDSFTGGGGQDSVQFGDGNNLIQSKNSQDVILVGNGSNQIYTNTQTDIVTAINNAKTASGSRQKGDLISVGSGNNTIFSSTANDAIFMGSGNNLVVLGAGNDTVTGGDTVSSATFDWKFTLKITGNLYDDVLANASDNTSGGYTPTAELYQYQNQNGYHLYNWDSNFKPLGLGNDTIIGGSGNYDIRTSNGNNYVDLGSGNSVVFAGAGSNIIIGGSGKSTIVAGSGNDYINGESGNDYIIGEAGNNTIFGGTGDDTIYAGVDGANAGQINLGNNYVSAGNGNTTIWGSGGDDTLVAGGGTDSVVAGNGNATVFGGSGNSSLYGGLGQTLIRSASGNDLIVGNDGNNSIYGGSGQDTIYASGNGADWADAGSNSHYVQAGSGTSIIYGSGGSDTLLVGSGNASIYAGNGTESLAGGDGSDSLYGGGGSNTFSTGIGSNLMVGGDGSNFFIANSGQSTLQGGSGSNTYQLDVGFGTVEIDPGSSGDTLNFGPGISLSNITVSAGFAADGSPALQIDDGSGDTLIVQGGLDGSLNSFNFAGNTSVSLSQLMALATSSDSNLTGSNGALIFTANAGESLSGGSGADTLYDWGANDTLVAGSGNSTLKAYTPNAVLVGGAGNDTFVINNSSDTIKVAAGTGNDTIMSAASYALPANVQNLILTGTNNLSGKGNNLNDTIIANNGNDTLTAGTGLATLIGGGGNDTFVVNNSNDVIMQQATTGTNTVISSISYALSANLQNLTLTGAANLSGTGNNLNNIITANNGNDTLIAGSGAATLIGGKGNDTFVVNNVNDVVQAVSSGKNVNSIQASVSYTTSANVQKLSLTGTASLTATGSNLNNLITANSGNDTLIASGGSGSLIGGAGVDTFVLAAGSYTAVKQAGAQAIVQIGSGLNFANLLAEKSGNDLLLEIGQKDNLRVKDYFLHQQSWTLEDSAGNAVSIPTLLVATTQAKANQLAFLENNFINQVKDNYVQQLQQAGYVQQVDGSWFSGPVDNQINVSAIYQIQHQVTHYDVVYTNSANHSTQTSSQNVESWLYSNGGTITDQSAAIQQITTNSSDAVIFAQNGASSSNISSGWINVNWSSTNLPPTVTKYKFPAFPVNQLDTNNANALIVDEYQSGTISDSLISGTTFGGIVYNPNSADTQGIYPRYVPITISSYANTNLIQQINVIGAGLHTVYGNANVLVSSGAGDNTIEGAGFVDAGTGNDTINSVGTVYCNSGNDTISSVDTVYTGSGNVSISGAGTVYCGGGNDTIIGANQVYGGSGNNLIRNAHNVVVGSGNDTIFGAGGGGVISINPLTAGMDVIGNTPTNSVDLALLQTYYTGLKVSNAVQRYEYGGLYYAYGGYYQTYQQAAFWANYGYTTVTYINPLPSLVLFSDAGVPLSAYYATANVPVTKTFISNDFVTLKPYFLNSSIPAETIRFGAGLKLADIKFSWGQVTDNQQPYTTFDLNWGSNQGIQVVMPHSNDVLGSGIQEFVFADGSKYNIADLLALAPPGPGLDPEAYVYQLGMGLQAFPDGHLAVQFGAGISVDMLSLSLGPQGQLLITIGSSGDAIEISQFAANNADQALTSIQNFLFADGLTLSYQQMLARGFDITGTTGDQSLTGTNLDNRIYAGSGNDTLIGSGANDTLTAGSGVDTLIGGYGKETFVVNSIADVVQASLYAVSNTELSSVSLVAAEYVNSLILTGSADLTATGNDAYTNVITGNQGSDTLIAGSGNDTLIAVSANDTLYGGSGADSFVLATGGIYIINDVAKTIVDTIQANYDNLTLSDNLNAGVTGNNDTITGGSGEILSLNGNNDALTLGSGSTLNLSGSKDSVNLSNGVITVQSNTSASLSGNNNVFNLLGVNNIVSLAGSKLTAKGNGNNLSLSGTGNSLAVSSANLTVAANTTAIIQGTTNTLTLGAKSTLNLSGDHNNISGGSNDTLAISGNNNSVSLGTAGNLIINNSQADTASLSNSTITVLANSTNVSLIGDSNVLNLLSGINVIISGSVANAFGNGDSISLTGSANTLAVSAASLQVTANSAANILGSNNTINLNMGDTVTLTGDQNTLYDLLSNTLNIKGNNESLTLGSNDTVSISGYGEMINASGDNLTLVNNSSATAYGSNTAVISGSYNTINAGINEVLSLNGNYNTVTMASGASLNLAGNQNNASLNSGSITVQVGSNANLTGSKDVLTLLDLGEIVNFSGTTLTATHNGNTVNLTGTSNILDISNASLTVADSSVATISGSVNSLTLGVKDTLTLTGDQNSIIGGSSDTMKVSGNNNSVALGTAGKLSINGNNETLTLGTGVTLTLSGTNENINGSSDNLTFGDNSNAIVNGSKDTIHVGSNNIVTVTGLNNIIYASNDTLTLNSSTDKIIGTGNTIFYTASASAIAGSAAVNQLIQAMATFDANSAAADTTSLPPAILSNNINLATPVHVS